MMRSESIAFDAAQVVELERLVAAGEGMHLEFKRKVSFPEKVVRELIAFANTEGGTLLIGVDDNKTIPGVKFPEEESISIHQELSKHCRPALAYHESVIPISEKRFVLKWRIPKSERRPHFYVANGERISFVRQRDQSIRASKEMSEILRRRKSTKGTRFTYGEAEKQIIHFLDKEPAMGLHDAMRVTGLNRYLASRTVVRLVLANVLRITPTEKGDLYSRV
jgi:predicted HTH transcriptional regulator